jgi:hypothetical protein
MLPAPLNLLARTIPLGDVRQLHLLVSRLIDPPTRREERWHHSHTAAAIEARYPRQFRLNEAELAVRRVTQSMPKGATDLAWLDEIFDDYYRFDGDQVVARENRRLSYARLCTKMHPALPVAWKLSGLVDGVGGERLKEADLFRIIEQCVPSFLAQPNNQDHWADLHVHLGGASETSLSLFYLAVGRWKIPQSAKSPSSDHSGCNPIEMQQWLATYQTLFAELLSLLLSPSRLEKFSPRHAIKTAWRLGQPCASSFNAAAWIELHKNVDGLRGKLARRAIVSFHENDAQRAWLYWLTALCCLFRASQHYPARDSVLAFLNIAQLFRSDMIHDGLGLARFVRYFGSPLRTMPAEVDRSADGLRQLLQPERQFAELKLADWIANKDSVAKFITSATKLLYRPSRTDQSSGIRKLLGRTHACIHFLRTADSNSSRTVRHAAQRRSLVKQSIKVDNFMRSVSASRATVINLPVDLTSFIRGLDVAGDELLTPVEVFAPTLRWLRRSPKQSLVPGDLRATSQLHLSIHAGEDFNHILGGMRAIDETVQFCDMGRNDRLGHALALGVRPNDWINRQSEVFLTAQEHLDNLVWAWHYSIVLSGRWIHASAVAMRLAARINIYSRLLLTTNSGSLSPESLFHAWWFRRNCPTSWADHRLRATRHSALKYFVPDFSSLDSATSSLPFRLFQEYHRRPDKADHDVRNNVILLRRGEGLPTSTAPWTDWISDIELDFIELLQDYLMASYTERGLSIEVNPSSNVYIGRIDDYHMHPIFRWHPPNANELMTGKEHNRFGLRNGPMRVSVNTDDPGIFPTTLPNEFQLLREAAQLHHNVGSREAGLWCDEIRRFGLERFADSHINMRDA